MSHFTVLVVGNNIEEQLATFDENDEACENPKWDWWLIGGRWTGYFKMKPGTQGAVGEPGVITEEPKPGYADQARKGDIDIEGMRDDAGNRAGERWDAVYAAVGHLDDFVPWKQMLDNHGKENIDAARTEYHSQRAIKALQDAAQTNYDLAWIGLDQFVKPRDRFVANARAGALATFAVLMDGEWFERGEMSWWGIVANESPEDVWHEKFDELFNNLSDDTLLTIVDCHI